MYEDVDVKEPIKSISIEILSFNGQCDCLGDAVRKRSERRISSWQCESQVGRKSAREELVE